MRFEKKVCCVIRLLYAEAEQNARLSGPGKD